MARKETARSPKSKWQDKETMSKQQEYKEQEGQTVMEEMANRQQEGQKYITDRVNKHYPSRLNINGETTKGNRLNKQTARNKEYQ